MVRRVQRATPISQCYHSPERSRRSRRHSDPTTTRASTRSRARSGSTEPSTSSIRAPVLKVDFFVCGGRPFDQSLMERRRREILPGPSRQSAFVVSPEDIILLKLAWFRLGAGVSEMQWRDLLGVVRIQAGQLDEAYLDHWAAELEVVDLLEELRIEA